MQWAKDNGYDQVYLESMPELSKAVNIYENVGFKKSIMHLEIVDMMDVIFG